jgi:exodeoxyribonuclease VII small subunit
MRSDLFKEAYNVMKRHAQTLRNQQEPNIDDLLSIVTETVAAYKVCQERINAVESALEKALSDPAIATNGLNEQKNINTMTSNADDDGEFPPF